MGPGESNGPAVSQGGAGRRLSTAWVCMGSYGRAVSNDHSGRAFNSLILIHPSFPHHGKAQ